MSLGTIASGGICPTINARGQDKTVPVIRYFAYVGCVLVVLLLAANWIWPAETKTADPNAPSPQAVAAESPFEQTIRIQSTRRWPEKIVFDTNRPTIVLPPAPHVTSLPPPPPPAPVVADNSPLDARAQLKPVAPPAKQRHARARHPASRPDFFNPHPDGWHDPWRDPWRQHSNAFASAGPMGPSWQFGRW